MELLRPEIRIEECSSTYGKITIEPLERGYGVTLGNALRRVLLSSIRGAAISSVRIDGVLHEFSTVAGVREDVIGILLNLKRLSVRCHSNEVRVLRLEVEGPKRVTAAEIQPDSEVEFADPDAYICTMEEGAKLSMDLYVEQGTGYGTSERPRPPYLPADGLVIDALFSPVMRVNYEVEAARVGHRTDYERLVLEVWTNGVVAPDLAVCEAAATVKGYFGIIVDEIEKAHPSSVSKESPTGPVETPSEGVRVSDPEKDDFLSKPVHELELSIRSENCLLRGGIHTIGDLLSKNKEDLLKIRNLGKISLREIEEKVEKLGIELKNEKSGVKPEE